MRQNIDPLEEFQDADIWNALAQVSQDRDIRQDLCHNSFIFVDSPERICRVS